MRRPPFQVNPLALSVALLLAAPVAAVAQDTPLTTIAPQLLLHGPCHSRKLRPLEKAPINPTRPKNVVVPAELLAYKSSRVEYVCVLAASLGGPAG